MPTYSYYCEKCEGSFEKFFYISNYKERVRCPDCNKTCQRDYDDILTQATSVKKSDTELKTIGDLANRNRDKLSTDERVALDQRHNEYKDTELEKELPKGMSRMKKPNKKIKWR